jgi:hypothetical protein
LGVSAPKFAQRRVPIIAANDFGDCGCGQLARAQGVIDSFACERLDHTSCVPDEKQIFMSGENRRTGQRRDRPPGLIGR